MASLKYRLNTSTLEFEKVNRSFREKIIHILLISIPALFVAVSLLLLSGKFIQTPRMQYLEKKQSDMFLQLQIMQKNISFYKEKLADLQYNDDHIYRTYFEVNPLSTSLREAGFGGNEYYDQEFTLKYRPLLSSIGNDLDMLNKQLVVQTKSFEELIDMAANKEKRLAARPAIQPISIKELTRFGSSFGLRMHPILHVRRMHEGIDLTAPRGTDVFATADGKVISAGYTTGGYGNKIIVDHGFGYRTLYGHLLEIKVKKGQIVKRGDVIAAVGSTGLSAAPHLHYEVHVNGRAVNPVNYYANDLTAEEYDHMIELLENADPSFDIN